MDYYMNDQNCVDRLFAEWGQHGKIIIAYDMDDTVFDFHNKGLNYEAVVSILREAESVGAYFICFTGRNDIDVIKQYLIANKIPFDKINENMAFSDFPGRKVYANIYLDDRAGLSASYDILKRSLVLMQDYISKQG